MKPLLRSLANNRRFIQRLDVPVRIVRTYEVPGLVGISKNAKTVYVDRRLRRNLNYRNTTVDITDLLVLRVCIKKAALDILHTHSGIAHRIANAYLDQALRDIHLPQTLFRQFLYRQKKTSFKRLPPDLDVRVYAKRPFETINKNSLFSSYVDNVAGVDQVEIASDIDNIAPLTYTEE